MALKAEVSFAKETLTKRPKVDDCFRIRDRTTNKDLTSNQYAENLSALFSNIHAVAEVPKDMLKQAMLKATLAAGIEYIAVGDSSEAESMEVDPTSSIHSPGVLETDETPQHFESELIAFATKNEHGRSWFLAMVDTVHSSQDMEVSPYIPVPGRLGENRVAFFPPEEDTAFQSDGSSILPIPPIVSQQMLNGSLVYVVNNHEEVDCILAGLKEISPSL